MCMLSDDQVELLSKAKFNLIYDGKSGNANSIHFEKKNSDQTTAEAGTCKSNNRSK